MADDNLLSVLNRWACHQEENFLSEAYAYLLRHLAKHEPATAAKLVSLLVSWDEQVRPAVIQTADIDTQVRLPNGIPDIVIRNESPAYLVCVEVKHLERDNPVHLREKLDKYIDDLTNMPEMPSCCVALVSRYPQPVEALPEGAGRFFAGEVQWHQIATVLRKATPKPREPVTSFLIDQFVQFLQGKGMTIDTVEPGVGPGLKAAMHLMHMLGDILKEKKLEHWPDTYNHSWCWYLGYDIKVEERVGSLGVYFEEADRIWFEVDGTEWGRPEGWDDRDWGHGIEAYGKSLDMDKGFFDGDAERQRQRVDAFVSARLEDLSNTALRTRTRRRG